MTVSISVSMIVHNGEREVGRALGSIAMQTLPAAEVVIVDDGSNDGTPDILAQFAKNNENFRVIRNRENLGRSRSRNVALEAVSGDYVLFVDADDFLCHDALERLARFATYRGGKQDIVIGARRNFGVVDMRWKAQEHLSTLFKSTMQDISLRQYPVAGRDQFITGKLYRKKMLDENDIWFDTERRNAEDIMFSFSTWKAARSFSFLPERVYCYAQGNFLGKATVEKVEDAYFNYMKCVDVIRKEQDETFRRELLINICYGLEGLFMRASHVFGPQELSQFMERFSAFFTDLPKMSLDRSPSRVRKAAFCILSDKPDEAAAIYLAKE